MLTGIANLAGFIVDAAEALVNDILSSLGINLGSLTSGRRDALLTPLQPILDAAAEVLNGAGPIADTLTGLLDAVELFADSYDLVVRDALVEPLLFANVVVGDADPGAADDLLEGLSVPGIAGDGIFGLSANDTILADDGDDFLIGGTGDDFLSGGEGDDESYGGAGNDTYLFGANFGSDLVADTDGVSILTLAAGTALSFERAGEDLDISVEGTADRVRFDS